MSVINSKNRGGGNPDSNLYSPVMLACFSKITQDQMERVLSELNQDMQGMNQQIMDALEPEEIDDLVNVDSLKNKSDKELKKIRNNLEKGIKEFQQMDEELSGMGEERMENERGNAEQNKKKLVIVFVALNFILFAAFFLLMQPKNENEKEEGEKKEKKE
jgi:tRNA(Met) C34 N-acetyltransferase TmcA